MDATFLVKLSVADPSSIPGLVEEIHDLLADELPVIEVKPWTRPSLGEPGTTGSPGDYDSGLPGPLDLPNPLSLTAQ